MNDDSSARIVTGLRQWIAAAPPAARLPSTRALAKEYGAGPVTVQKALRVLVGQGLVETRPGAGTYVRAARPVRPADVGWQTTALGVPRTRPGISTALRTAPPDAVALHSGYPARDLLPERLVRAAFGRAGRSEAVVSRPPAAGLPELRAWFAAELGAMTPIGVTPPAPRDVIVFPGSQSGLNTAFRALVGSGRPLLMESPTYWGAILAAAQAGVEVVPVASGPEGPDPVDLERAFDATGARVFYAQPTFANPTGACWSPGRSEEVLAVVRRHGAFLIEDDWAHDFALLGDPVPIAAHDDSGHVIHLRSLTKSVSPAVRVAGLVARGPARDRILADAQAESMYVSGVLQAVALDVVTQPGWRTHLRSTRQQLASRRDLLVQALADDLPEATLDLLPVGGLNLWLRLPDGTDLPHLVSTCAAAGVVVAPGDEWFPAEPTGAYLRLNYAGPDPSSWPAAIRVVAEMLRQRRSR